MRNDFSEEGSLGREAGRVLEDRDRVDEVDDLNFINAITSSIRMKRG